LKKENSEVEMGGKPVFLNGDAIWKSYGDALDAFEVSVAIGFASAWVAKCNEYIDAQKPWAKDSTNRKEVLSVLAENLRHITLMLLPFIPQTAQKMAKQLNLPYADKMLEKDFVITEQMKAWGGEKGWAKVGEPSILFAPLEK
jgi:methionyl-tRNA synthetase